MLSELSTELQTKGVGEKACKATAGACGYRAKLSGGGGGGSGSPHSSALSTLPTWKRGESFAQQNLSFCSFLLMSGNTT